MLPVLAWFLLMSPLFISVQSFCRPAVITLEPPSKIMYFRENREIYLPCEAMGDPEPEYTWKKDGKDYRPPGNDPRVVQLPGKGTLVFKRAQSKDAGSYQCFATNDFGTSMSFTVSLIEADIDDFKKREHQTHTVKLGEPFFLPCDPPKSLPKGNTQWFIQEKDESIRLYSVSRRVMVDDEYILRFTHVSRDDELDLPYVCVTFNDILTEQVIGPRHFIKIAGAKDKKPPVQLLWASPSKVVGLKGTRIFLRCIFSGNPTPQIQWQKLDKSPKSERMIVRNQELIIDDIRPEDEGRYKCWTTDPESNKIVSHTINVKVQAEAAIQYEDKNKHLQTGKGGMASFHCRVEGIPKPEVDWFVNGSKLTDSAMKKADINIKGNTLRVENLKLGFSMVVQCKAHNIHNSVMATSSLCVSAGAPEITKHPDKVVYSIASNEVNMTCQFASRRRMRFRWLKDGVKVTGDRFQILPGGGLNIKALRLGDAGLYQCEANRNTYTTTSCEGKLVVCEESPCPSAANTVVSLSQLTLLCLIVLFVCL